MFSGGDKGLEVGAGFCDATSDTAFCNTCWRRNAVVMEVIFSEFPILHLI